MKRFVLTGKASVKSVAATVFAAGILTACNWMPMEESGEIPASLQFNFIQTKAPDAALPDTNSFILSVVNSSTGSVAYNGPYGSRPSALNVTAGTYDVSVRSREFGAPAFEAPLYGDEKVVLASSGETVKIKFLCTQLNCGVKMEFSDLFKQKYSGGHILLSQESGTLQYAYNETRTAYVFPGTVRFVYDDNSVQSTLFTRNVGAGELRRISLDATIDESQSSFTIEIDTTTVLIPEEITVGDESAGDGLSAASALSIAEVLAGDFKGDTLWVYGYVAGVITDDLTIAFEESGFTADNNIAIAPSASVRDAASCLGIYLSKSADKAALNLVNEDNRKQLLGRKIYARGKVDVYKKIVTIKNLCDYVVE